MAWRFHGRASVDPDSSKAWASCDRCGFNYNLCNLHQQFEWSGRTLFSKHLIVCDRCLDVPAPFLRTPVLPPDPPPVLNARIEPYSIDETDFRVTTDGSIRETEDPLDQPRITENDTETG
jgi:hypothetical protein